MRVKNKVICYFLRSNNEQLEVLVFDHRDQPEAGTQVIGGTVEEFESLEFSLIREVREEAGILISKKDLYYLGHTTYQRKDREEVNERDYFLIYNPNFKLLDYFEHHVRSDGEDNGMVFCFYWISIKAACEQLTGNFHEKLGEACVLYKKL